MRIDRLYVLIGFLWLIAGMIFGIYLGIKNQLQSSNSHAHANLLGFVISVLFGLIYRNWPVLKQSRLVVLGPGFAERRANDVRSLADGAISSTVIHGRKADHATGR